MKTRYLSIYLAAMLSSSVVATPPSLPNGHWVGGYYSNWSYWRGQASIKSLDNIKKVYGSANFVTYAFLGITTSRTLLNHKLTPAQQGSPGSIVDSEALIDSKTDSCKLYPKDFSACALSKVMPYLKRYASSSKGTILMASLGGWTYTQYFTDFYQDAKANPAVLDRFIESSRNWLLGHPEYSGIDIDWEYPGLGHSGVTGGIHAGEGHFYMKMLGRLRTMLDTLGRIKGRHYYLTSAVVGSPFVAQAEVSEGVDWKQVAAKVDWLNLMAFDLGSGSVDVVKDAVHYYLDQGVPSRKLILGVEVGAGITDHAISALHVPYYPVFALDTPTSLIYKLRQVLEPMQLGGVWFWELTQDTLDDPAHSLFGTACIELGEHNHRCIK